MDEVENTCLKADGQINEIFVFHCPDSSLMAHHIIKRGTHYESLFLFAGSLFSLHEFARLRFFYGLSVSGWGVKNIQLRIINFATHIKRAHHAVKNGLLGVCCVR